MARRRPQQSRGSAPSQAGAPYQVFISHATADKWLARTLCERLEGVGATTFRDDRDIGGGDDIPQEIFRQIRQSQEFLVLLTPASVNRPWILLEVGAACGRDPPPRIIVIRYYVETDNIPSMIQSKKGFHLNELEAYLEEVASRVAGRQETSRERGA
jgi:hypothetical protein